jgi:hypothetical protein
MIKQVFISCILFSLLVWSNTIIAQTNKDLEFNVVKPKVEINITPAYNYLYQNISHPLNIVIHDSLHQYVIKLAGGTLNETDSGTFITPEVPDEAILNIYEIKKGKEILVGSKKYTVLPEPMPFIRNKPTDSFINDVLLLTGKLDAITTLKGKKIVVEVKSFTVTYIDESSNFKSLDIIGNELTKEACKEMIKLTNGSLIYFENIMIELVTGYESIIQPYRVTMEVINSKDVIKIGN